MAQILTRFLKMCLHSILVLQLGVVSEECLVLLPVLCNLEVASVWVGAKKTVFHQVGYELFLDLLHILVFLPELLHLLLLLVKLPLHLIMLLKFGLQASCLCLLRLLGLLDLLLCPPPFRPRGQEAV